MGVSLSLQEKVLLIKVSQLWGSACRYKRRFYSLRYVSCGGQPVDTRFYSLRYVSCGGQPVVTREGFTH